MSDATTVLLEDGPLDCPDYPDHAIEKTGVITGTGVEIIICTSCGDVDPPGTSHLLAQSGRYEFTKSDSEVGE